MEKGDKVKRIMGSYRGMRLGDTATIKQVRNSGTVSLEEYTGFHSVDSLELVNSWTEGKTVIRSTNNEILERKILGVAGKVILLSRTSNLDRFSYSVSNTKKYLKEKGYRLKDEEQEVEMTVRAVAEKLGVDPSKLKIVD